MLTPNPLIELDRSKNYLKMTNENDFFIAKDYKSPHWQGRGTTVEMRWMQTRLK